MRFVGVTVAAQRLDVRGVVGPALCQGAHAVQLQALLGAALGAGVVEGSAALPLLLAAQVTPILDEDRVAQALTKLGIPSPR